MRILFLGEKRDYFLERDLGQEIDWKKFRFTWYEELFRDEIGRQCDVVHYGSGYIEDFNPDLSVKEIVGMFGDDFDIILTSCMLWEHFKGFNDVKYIPKVTIAAEVYNNAFRMGKTRTHFANHKYDLLFGFSSLVTFWAEQWEYAKHFEILPFSVDINVYQKWNIPKRFDVMGSFNSFIRAKRSPVRHQIKRLLQEKMPLTSWTKRSYYIDNVIKINQSKICLNYLHQGFFNPRYFEVLACGGFLLTDQPVYDLKRVGLKAGKHFATFKGLEDLEEKIEYWLNHKKERKRIARQGMRFVRRYHNTKVRVKEFIQKVEKFLRVYRK